MSDATINADRFTGFSDLYDDARPHMPQAVADIITRYLGGRPGTVVDLGCGTGLSALIWRGRCDALIGIDPSEDMISLARGKDIPNAKWVSAFSHDTGLDDGAADVVVCSQSFHWMNPADTLPEIARILRPGGVFAAVDCDWPPVCGWEAERAYGELFANLARIESGLPAVRESYIRFPKDRHLQNIKDSGLFRHAREVLLYSAETGGAQRFIDLAMSQGGLQKLLMTAPEKVAPYIERFEREVRSVMGESEEFGICYRCRIGVK